MLLDCGTRMFDVIDGPPDDTGHRAYHGWLHQSEQWAVLLHKLLAIKAAKTKAPPVPVSEIRQYRDIEL